MEIKAKSCACSGIRCCILCDKKLSQSTQLNKNVSQSQPSNCIFWFCIQCSKIFRGDISKAIDCNKDTSPCSFHNGRQSCDSLKLNGIHVYPNFITHEEEKYLLDEINKKEWMCSQSGRRKQDFRPKVNFKRKKVKVGNFNGFPLYCEFLLHRLKDVGSLSQFCAVELCNLEYMSERGSSIDPHVDDTWLWGEQLVTLNLLSDTILTLKKVSPIENNSGDSTNGEKSNGDTLNEEKYNGDTVNEEKNNGDTINEEKNNGDTINEEKNNGDNLPPKKLLYTEVQVLAPSKSLLILEGDARYAWMHAIKREHVGEKRIAMTFRNLSTEFEAGGEQYEFGRKLIELAQSFGAAMSL